MDIGFRHEIIFSATRVEVLSKNNVRLAVNSGEKNFFHRKAPSSFSFECGESAEFLKDLRFLAVKKFFHRIHQISYKRETVVQGFEPLTGCHQIRIPLQHLSHASMVSPVNLR